MLANRTDLATDLPWWKRHGMCVDIGLAAPHPLDQRRQSPVKPLPFEYIVIGDGPRRQEPVYCYAAVNKSEEKRDDRAILVSSSEVDVSLRNVFGVEYNEPEVQLFSVPREAELAHPAAPCVNGRDFRRARERSDESLGQPDLRHYVEVWTGSSSVSSLHPATIKPAIKLTCTKLDLLDIVNTSCSEWLGFEDGFRLSKTRHTQRILSVAQRSRRRAGVYCGVIIRRRKSASVWRRGRSFGHRHCEENFVVSGCVCKSRSDATGLRATSQSLRAC